MIVSGSGVRSIWQRHDLENFKKRLSALEAKVAQDGAILTLALWDLAWSPTRCSIIVIPHNPGSCHARQFSNPSGYT